MHSHEDRIRAVERYYRYGKKASVVVRVLGYPPQNSRAIGGGLMKIPAVIQRFKAGRT